MSTENKQKRESIAAKVRALLTKTVERGCTEAEAMASAAKASQLMAEYDLTFKDLEAELRDETYGNNSFDFREGRTWHPVVGFVVVELAAFWDCKVWTSSASGKLNFFGEKSDTENARHMLAMLKLAMDYEWSRYLNSPDRPAHVHGRTLRASFMPGMGERLAARLRELKAERSKSSTTGTSLVVVKSAIVAERHRKYLSESGIKLKTGYQTARPTHAGAFSAGAEAANRVDLGNSQKVTGQ